MINSGLNTVLDMDMDILAKQEQWKRTSIARNVISFFRIKNVLDIIASTSYQLCNKDKNAKTVISNQFVNRATNVNSAKKLYGN